MTNILYCNTNNLKGYRCNTTRKKSQVKQLSSGETGTQLCKKKCENNPDCKGFYTRIPKGYKRNTMCYLCTGEPNPDKSFRRSSKVKDYNICSRHTSIPNESFFNQQEIKGYRCNTTRKKSQVKQLSSDGETGTQLCKKKCKSNPDCKGFYTRIPKGYKRNTMCYLCTGEPNPDKSFRRSSNVKDYHILSNVSRTSDGEIINTNMLMHCPYGAKCNGDPPYDSFVCKENRYQDGNICKKCPKKRPNAPEGSLNEDACRKPPDCNAGMYYNKKYRECYPCPSLKPYSPIGSDSVNDCTITDIQDEIQLPPPQRYCCHAMTDECQACKAGLSVAEYKKRKEELEDVPSGGLGGVEYCVTEVCLDNQYYTCKGGCKSCPLNATCNGVGWNCKKGYVEDDNQNCVRKSKSKSKSHK